MNSVFSSGITKTLKFLKRQECKPPTQQRSKISSNQQDPVLCSQNYHRNKLFSEKSKPESQQQNKVQQMENIPEQQKRQIAFLYKEHEPKSEPYSQKNKLNEQFQSWIQDILNPDVCESCCLIQAPEKTQQLHSTSPNSESTSNKNQIKSEGENVQKNRLSFFHNIHKHLISYLKKVHIRRADLENHSQGLKAYELWKIFKESKDYTKKSLYLIFGVQGSHNLDNLLKMTSSHPELSRILSKASIEEVEEAQSLIRETVVHQVSQTTKNSIKSQCRMAKFDEFYDYLQAFLEELSEKGLSVRISKEQKSRLVHRTIPTQQSH